VPTKTLKHKVVVVGAGPGGVAASIDLSQRGIPHLVLEKSTFPRDKICGDAISGKVMYQLNRILPEASKAFCDQAEKREVANGIYFGAPNGNGIGIQSPKPRFNLPVGMVSTRLDFDNFLFEQMLKYERAEVWQGVKVNNISRNAESNWVQCQYNGESYEIEADLIIGADGQRSVVAKTFKPDLQEANHFCAGLRAYYTNVTGFHGHNYLELHFIKQVLPGYLWIFPLPNGQANVGIGMLSSKVREKQVNLKATLNKALEEDPYFRERFKNANLEGKIQGWGLPLGSKKRNISGDGFMLVGDAASLIDPFTGEGIGNAMLSAKIAVDTAERAMKADDFSASTLNQYDKAVYKKLWKELQLSHQLQKLSTKPWLFNFVVNRIQKNKGLQELFTTMFKDVDLRKQMKNPLFYFRLLFR